MCGADYGRDITPAAEDGSSPRVRSRHEDSGLLPEFVGIISACAEQTLRVSLHLFHVGDHLRVCGADVNRDLPKVGERGSSPRVRSRLGLTPPRRFTRGIISACAEQTKREHE